MSTRPLIYLSLPYSHENLFVVEARIDAFVKIAAQVEREGQFHAVSALFNQLLLDHGQRLPRDTEFWLSYSRSLVGASERLAVIRLPGWDSSKGVLAEIDYANDSDKPVEFWDSHQKLTPEMTRIITRASESCAQIEAIGH